MECRWFFGADLRTAAILIAVLGITHPLLWVIPAQRFRSEWFMALYILTGGWCLVSILLLIGILTDVAWLHWIWIWFTVIFVVVMLIAMILMVIGFCVLYMRKIAVFPALGIVYYLLTIYFICVVATQRKQMVHLLSSDGDVGSGVLRERWATATTALLTPTIIPPRRGRCMIPPRDPANGWYSAKLPSGAWALPGHAYDRLKVMLNCNKYYTKRGQDYSLCYFGGWSLPLPDCVKDKSFYEEYYDIQETTVAQSSECELPRPPHNGYFIDTNITRSTIRLGVQCLSMHFLVGWQRMTCHDGVWNHPVPKCVYMDNNICTLLPHGNLIRYTCLPSPTYTDPYRCNRGVVPHGTVVEPRCVEGHYVWGPYSFMHCVNGMWHPKMLVQNLTCVPSVDIYRHYETSIATTTTTRSTIHDEYDDNPAGDATLSTKRKRTRTTKAAIREITDTTASNPVISSSIYKDRWHARELRKATIARTKTAAVRARIDAYRLHNEVDNFKSLWKSPSEPRSFLSPASAETLKTLFTEQNIMEPQSTTHQALTARSTDNKLREKTHQIPISSNKLDIWHLWNDEMKGTQSSSADSITKSDITDNNIWKTEMEGLDLASANSTKNTINMNSKPRFSHSDNFDLSECQPESADSIKNKSSRRVLCPSTIEGGLWKVQPTVDQLISNFLTKNKSSMLSSNAYFFYEPDKSNLWKSYIKRDSANSTRNQSRKESNQPSSSSVRILDIADNIWKAEIEANQPPRDNLIRNKNRKKSIRRSSRLTTKFIWDLWDAYKEDQKLRKKNRSRFSKAKSMLGEAELPQGEEDRSSINSTNNKIKKKGERLSRPRTKLDISDKWIAQFKGEQPARADSLKKVRKKSRWLSSTKSDTFDIWKVNSKAPKKKLRKKNKQRHSKPRTKLDTEDIWKGEIEAVRPKHKKKVRKKSNRRFSSSSSESNIAKQAQIQRVKSVNINSTKREIKKKSKRRVKSSSTESEMWKPGIISVASLNANSTKKKTKKKKKTPKPSLSTTIDIWDIWNAEIDIGEDSNDSVIVSTMKGKTGELLVTESTRRDLWRFPHEIQWFDNDKRDIWKRPGETDRFTSNAIRESIREPRDEVEESSVKSIKTTRPEIWKTEKNVVEESSGTKLIKTDIWDSSELRKVTNKVNSRKSMKRSTKWLHSHAIARRNTRRRSQRAVDNSLFNATKDLLCIK